MLSDTMFEVLKELECAVREYEHSQHFKEELKQIMTALFSIQYSLDMPQAEDVWPVILQERMEQWEQMFVSKTS
jgi:hypothetical protein